MVREFNNKHFAKLQFLSHTKKEASFHHPFPLFLCFGSTTLVLLPPPATSTHFTFKHRIPFLLVFELCPIFLAKTKKIKRKILKTTI